MGSDYRDRVVSSYNSPLLAVSSGKNIVVWEHSKTRELSWTSVAVSHGDEVGAIAFDPQSLRLASVGKDGWLHIWHRGQELIQSFQGSSNGLSHLSWHPQGNHLLVGGEKGEILLWSQT